MKTIDLMKKKVSVVVPVYNREKQLSQCVESLIGQDFKNLEILLVDDGSTDSSLQICQHYGKIDNRIIVIHKSNGGVSTARNLGINRATGDYICFVDSDDYVTSQYISQLLRDAELHSEALIFHNYGTGKYAITEYKVLHDKEIIEYLFGNQIILKSGPVAKLFDLNVLKKCKVFFPENIHMGEDYVFILNYLRYVNTVVISPQNNYIVINTLGSLSKCYYTFEQEYEGYSLQKKYIIDILKKYNISPDKYPYYIWNIAAHSFIRVTQCVFRAREKLGIMEQTRKLDKLSFEDVSMMNAEYYPSKFRLKIMKFLIVHRYFLLYSLVGSFDNWINKKKQ